MFCRMFFYFEYIILLDFIILNWETFISYQGDFITGWLPWCGRADNREGLLSEKADNREGRLKQSRNENTEGHNLNRGSVQNRLW